MSASEDGNGGRGSLEKSEMSFSNSTPTRRSPRHGEGEGQGEEGSLAGETLGSGRGESGDGELERERGGEHGERGGGDGKGVVMERVKNLRKKPSRFRMKFWGRSKSASPPVPAGSSMVGVGGRGSEEGVGRCG